VKMVEELHIRISDDGLTGTLTIAGHPSKITNRDNLLKSIGEAGICVGIDQEVLGEIFRKDEPVYDRVIARGIAPENGSSAELERKLGIHSGSVPSISEDGIANFRKLNQFEAVTENQLLAEIRSTGQGAVGRTVDGAVLTDSRNRMSLPAGSNTVVSDNGLQLYSGIDGYAFLNENLINVDRVYHIKGGVDFRTGNVNFDGMIIVDGDVRSGFRVEATDNIYISGTVEGAEVYSYKGDIAVRGGILGKGKAKVFAAGSLVCSFVQDATVGANKDVIIDHYSINSSVTSGERVMLQDNEGLIRGGKVRAEDEIQAIEAGSSQGISTSLHIRGGKMTVTSPELARLQRQRVEKQMRLRREEKKVNFYQILERNQRGLSEEKLGELDQANELVSLLSTQIEQDLIQEQDMGESAGDPSAARSVTINGRIYRGVEISIGQLNYFPEESATNVRFSAPDDKMNCEKLEEEKEINHV